MVISFSHRSVLLEETIELLAIQPGAVCVDATVGGAGHARRMADLAGASGLIIGIDQDNEALLAAEMALREGKAPYRLLRGNFRHMDQLLKEASLEPVDAILMDIGVSSRQLDEEERGFTYQKDAPLDMRMDQRNPLNAAELLRRISREELTRILREYGEERWAARIAQFIVDYRKERPLETTGQLVEIIKAAIPAAARRDGPHPARRTFQALRIAVNEELDALSEGLDAALEILKPDGRLAVITFHSLEDRIVKERFKTWARACHCPPEWPICQCGGEQRRVQIVTRHPITPTEEELRENPRSRSAKLRVCQRLVDSENCF